jgi:hypothetical protein
MNKRTNNIPFFKNQKLNNPAFVDLLVSINIMAQLEVRPRRRSYWWVWLIVIIIVVVACAYCYQHYYRGGSTSSIMTRASKTSGLAAVQPSDNSSILN